MGYRTIALIALLVGCGDPTTIIHSPPTDVDYDPDLVWPNTIIPGCCECLANIPVYFGDFRYEWGCLPGGMNGCREGLKDHRIHKLDILPTCYDPPVCTTACIPFFDPEVLYGKN